MTTSDYTVGPGRPPLHSRFQKGQSGNPGGRPGPAKQLKQRFHRALREALEMKPQALEAARPTDMLGALIRKMVLDALAGSDAARQRVLALLEREAGEKQDWVTRLEAERHAAPSFEEVPEVRSPVDVLTAALFSLSEGESEGESRKRIAEILKILDEIAPEPKEQGGNRDNLEA
jgi:hypothetical protein